MKKILSTLLVLVSIFTFTSCIWQEGTVKVRSREISRYYFNTYSAIYTYGDRDDKNIDKYAELVDGILSKYHQLFDIYYEYAGVNNIKTINKNAGKNPVKVDKELLDFLKYCKELYTLTGGKTNVMLGSVLKIWHDAREEAERNFGFLNPSELPGDTELSEAVNHTSIDLLVIDEEASTVYISDPLASLDVGAIGKGYTVEILYNRLKDMGADSVVLNIGGNLRTIGVKPDGENWVSGITNPDKESDEPLKCRIEIGDTAVVTSGDYERYFMSGDKFYHHIIDPVTLMPSEYFSAVSIITADSGLADALSTALFCMSYEDGLELVGSLGNVEVIWIYKDGSLKHTDGVKFVD